MTEHAVELEKSSIQMRTPTIAIKDLTRRFGALVAVDHVSIDVNRSEIFGLIGPNGAGKSTLIKMLTTLLPPTSGNALIGGYDIVQHAKNVRRSIGYVPQLLSADGSLTGYENMLLSARLYGLRGSDRDSRIANAAGLCILGQSETSYTLHALSAVWLMADKFLLLYETRGIIHRGINTGNSTQHEDTPSPSFQIGLSSLLPSHRR